MGTNSDIVVEQKLGFWKVVKEKLTQAITSKRIWVFIVGTVTNVVIALMDNTFDQQTKRELILSISAFVLTYIGGQSYVDGQKASA